MRAFSEMELKILDWSQRRSDVGALVRFESNCCNAIAVRSLQKYLDWDKIKKIENQVICFAPLVQSI